MKGKKKSGSQKSVHWKKKYERKPENAYYATRKGRVIPISVWTRVTKDWGNRCLISFRGKRSEDGFWVDEERVFSSKEEALEFLSEENFEDNEDYEDNEDNEDNKDNEGNHE